MLLLGGGPVWHFEALEDSPGLSVETDVSDALQESVWMEVLSVEVEHDVGLLVELIVIYVLDAKACFSGLFGVELVGQREQVGVRELHELRGVLLNASCGVVDELDPTGASLCSDVVLDGASNLALAEEGAVDELVQKGPL